MTLMMNEHGEFYRPEDFEPPRNPFAKYAELHPAMHGYGAPRRPIEFAAKRCETCGREYSPGAAHQKYCSKECRDAARRVGAAGKLPKSATCPVCGKVFAPKVHNMEYCSKKCRHGAQLEKRRERYRRERGRGTACVLVALALALAPWTARADEPLEVTDLPMRVEMVGGNMAHGAGAAFSRESAQEPISDGVGDSGGYFVESAQTEPYSGLEAPQTGYAQDTDGYYGYVAEYDPLYNTDGPSHEMPGWHDGYLETYYNASAHYRAGEWTLDGEGFYRDGDYYVVGVDIADINPNTGEPYQIGDVVETGKGEAVVMDYGSGARVHDFAVAW